MKIIAHRGARGYAPENTIAAFKKALEIGVDAIELDVYVLKSGEVVVIHDILVDRTTSGKGYVEDYTFDELRQLDAGDNEQIPRLGEVIELIDRRVPLFIELKAVGAGTPVAEIVNDFLGKGWQPADFEVISFIHQEILDFRTDCPEVRIGASLAGIPIDYCDYAQRIGADSVMLCVEFLTPAFVASARQHGLTVNGYTWEPFTADIQSEIKRIQALGVDGWCSDRPDVAKAHLEAL